MFRSPRPRKRLLIICNSSHRSSIRGAHRPATTPIEPLELRLLLAGAPAVQDGAAVIGPLADPALGEIRGTVWNDLDGDGVRDAGEPSLAGWNILLTPGGSTISGADGSYAFTALAAGTYTVSEGTPVGWQQTFPTTILGNLLVNGGFETGTLSGWTNQTPGGGSFVINDGTLDPASPDEPLPPDIGGFSAVSDSSGPGPRILYQDVTLPAGGPATLRWADRIRNHADSFQDPSQEYRVEIRDTADTVLATVFSTGPGDPLMSDWTTHNVNITSFAGQTIRIAFVEQGDIYFLNVHLDDVRVDAVVGGGAHSVTLASSQVVTGKDFGNKSTTPDTLAPAVTGVSSTLSDGTYGLGTTIPITITFSEAVFVNTSLGVPTLQLNSGGSAQYAGGDGTSVLTFNYIPAAGQNAYDLDYTSISALALNGAVLRDATGNLADLRLALPGAAGSLGFQKNIAISTPTVGAITATPGQVCAGVAVILTATDVLGPVTQVYFYRESNGVAGLQRANDALVGVDSKGSDGWSLSYSTTSLAVGTYTIYAAGLTATGDASNAVQTTCTIRPPSTGSLVGTPNPVYAGWPLTLTALDVSPQASKVEFWLEKNGTPGFQAGAEQLVSTDGYGSDGWSATISTTGLTAGTRTYYAIAYDSRNAAGNVVQTAVSIQSSSIASLAASPNPVYAGDVLTLRAMNVQGPMSAVWFYRETNGVPGLQDGSDFKLGSDGSATEGFSIAAPTSDLAAGTYTYYAVARDLSGNSGNTVQTTSTILPPSIGSLADAPDQAYAGDRLTLAAQDVLGNVTAVTFYMESNGTPGLQVGADLVIGSDNSGLDGWSVEMSTSRMDPGAYTYYAVAADGIPNFSNPVETTNTIMDGSSPNTPPSIGSLMDIPEQVYAGETVTLTAQGVAGSTTSVVFYRESNSLLGLQVGQDIQVAQDQNGMDGWSCVLETYGKTAATYTYYAVALDAAGNTSNPVEAANTIRPPAIGTLTSAPDQAYAYENVVMTAQNVVGLVSTVSFYYESNGTPGLQVGSDTLIGADTLASNGWSRSWNGASSPGTYTCYAVPTDTSNNAGSPTQGTITISPLSIGSMTVTPDQAYSASMLTLTAYDVRGPVSTVSFFRENNGIPGWQSTQETLLGQDTASTDGWSRTWSGSQPIGTYTYYAVATGSAGSNYPSNVVQTTVTIRPPNIGSLVISQDQAYAGEFVTLVAQGVLGTATRINFYREQNGKPGYQSTDSSLGSDTSVSDGWLLQASTTGLVAGTYVYYAIPVDAYGNAGNVVEITGTIRRPSIGLLTDSPESVQAGTPVTLTAQGVRGIVTTVSFYRESNGTPGLQVGSDTLVAADSNSADGWSVPASTTGRSAGSYRYYAVANDAAGNPSDPVETVNVIAPASPVDPPAIGLLSDAPDPAYAGTPITLTATNIAGSVLSVNFYRESNGTPGLQVGSDLSLNSDTNGLDGWSIVATTDGLVAGTHTYYAVAVYQGGPSSSSPAETTCRIRPPSIGSLVDTPEPAYSGPMLILRGQDVLGPATKVSFYRESNGTPGYQSTDNSLGSDTNGADGWMVQATTSSLPAGKHTYYAIAFDSANNASNIASTTNTLAPPSIGSLLDSVDPAYSSGSISLVAQDVVGAATRVVFYREYNNTPGLQTGTDSQVGLDSNVSDGFACTISLSGMAAGAYTYYAVANDTYGNTGSVVEITNTIRPPSIGSLADLPDPAYSGTQFTLTAVDVQGSPYRVVFYRERNGVSGLQTAYDLQVSADTGSSDGWWAPISTGSMAAGTYTYYAVANDVYGNLGNVVETTHTIRPPSIGSLAATPDTSYASTPITLMAQDVSSVTTRVIFYRESNGTPGLQSQDTQVGTDTTSSDGWWIQATTSSFAAGTYTYYAVASDTFGNNSNTVQTINTIRLPDILISNAGVAENQPVGTPVGSFSTIGSDVGTTFTYTLVSGAGSTDNASFTISGNQLRTAAIFNYESAPSRSIRVRSMDQGGLYADKTFTISVTNANDAPAAAAISRDVAFCAPLSFAPADFSGAFTDPDAGDQLASIRVSSLPAHGTLSLEGVPLAVGQEIAAAQLSSLAYAPSLDYLGMDSFTWSASDGLAWSALPAAVQLAVGPIEGWLCVPAGEHSIGVDLSTLSVPLTLDALAGARLTLTAAQQIHSIHVRSGATVQIAAGAGLLRTNSLMIDAGGQLDLCDNNLIVDYTGPTPLATIRQWLGNGVMGTGASIVTSTASPSPGHPTALGLVDNALLHLTTWSGRTLGSAGNFSQLLIKHTFAGDVDLDGKVARSDYLNIMGNMGRTGAQWFEGDQNHDGRVTVDDLAFVSGNIGAGDSTGMAASLLPAPAQAPAAAKSGKSATGSHKVPAAKKPARKRPAARRHGL